MESGTGSCHGLDFGDFSARIVRTDAVYCSGAFSCESGTFRGIAMLNFDGEFAGYHASAEGAAKINARSRNALSGARIDSAGIAEMSISVMGDMAGDGATVICREGSRCQVDCLGNACEGLSMVCEGATTDCVADCADDQGHVCPTITNGRDTAFNAYAELGFLNRAKVAISTLDDATTSCATAKQCFRDGISGHGDASCTGDESCAKATFTNGGDAVCEGNKACYESDFMGHDGDISCTGTEACANGQYDAQSGYDQLVCSGESSCSAMQATTVATGGVDSDCGGLKSCEDALLVMAAHADVSCGGEKSCYGSEIRVASDVDIALASTRASVACIGKHACQTADIAVDSVQCMGGNSCQQARMAVSGEVVLNGANSGLEAVLEVAASATITATGYNALMKAQIDSMGNDVSLELSGYNAGGKATLLCRAGSSCSLTCIAGGCLELSYVCEDGADCVVSPQSCMGFGEWNVASRSYCPLMMTELPEDDSSSKRGGGGGGHGAEKQMFVDDVTTVREGLQADVYAAFGAAFLAVSALTALMVWLWMRVVGRKGYEEV